MIESQEHFLTNRKQHTEIKHKIFHDTFRSILGISAKFSKNNSFTYLDLYAGQGKFSDDSFGSPMLALNTILESEVINSFHQLKCFFSEIDKTSYSELEKNISYLKSSKKSNPKVATYLHNVNWHEKNDDIENLLKFSKWGFIFVDPFSNEVNLNNLIELLQNHAKLQDYGKNWNRGHFVVADADFDYDKKALSKAYTMANIIPQSAKVNQRTWTKVERYGRTLAQKLGYINSISIAKYDDLSNKIGNDIVIPTKLYRIYYNNETKFEKCFEYENTLDVVSKNDKLKNHEIDCLTLRIK